MQPWVLAASLMLALPLTGPAAAQTPAAPRLLAVPSGTAWQHADTGIILPSQVAGLERTEVKDLSADELDVIATYKGQGGTVASVYVFRTLLPDVPLWFDRSMAAIATQPDFRQAEARVPATAFARPGASVASGLRSVLAIGSPGSGSTALAIAPLGGWLLKVRISSTSADAESLDRQLTAFVAGLRWPTGGEAERIAVPIRPCSDALRTKKAKLVKQDMGQSLINALIGGAPLKSDGPPATYCRDPGPAGQPAWAVYRPNGASDRYAVAMGDAGGAVIVSPEMSIAGLPGKGDGGNFSVAFVHHATSSVLPSFNRLPPPEQALALLRQRRVGISATMR